MDIQKVDTDIFVAVGETYRSNSLVFVKGGEALLVDGMASQADAEGLKAFVEGELGKAVRIIICTHYFSDHLAALRLFPHAHVIAHGDYLETFNSELFRSPEEAAHFVAPDITVSAGVTIRWGSFTLEVFHNPGHTPSTLAVDVPEADLIAAGDTVVGNIVYFAYGTPGRLASALRRLQERGRSRLVASHLGVRSSDALGNALKYLGLLETRVAAARLAPAQPGPVLAIELESCLPGGLVPTPFEKIFHQRNLQSVVANNYFAT